MRFSIYKNKNGIFNTDNDDDTRSKRLFVKLPHFKLDFRTNAIAYVCVCVFVDFAWNTKNVSLSLLKAFHVYKIDFTTNSNTKFMRFSRCEVSFLPSLLPLIDHVYTHFTLCIVAKIVCIGVELRIRPILSCVLCWNNGNRKIIQYQIDLKLFTNCETIFEITMENPYLKCFCLCSVYCSLGSLYLSDEGIKSRC